MATEFSIIIPTYQEAKNLPELTERISALPLLQSFEVIIVDDNSQDGTIETIAQLQSHYPWLHLITQRDTRSLSKAVMTGIEHSRYPVIIIMDADLSHPPEKIPDMLTALSQSDVDIVVGSRYIKGGSVDDSWPLSRRLISRCSALLAGIIVPIRDPLSGFIAVKKTTCFTQAKLEPIGWKIGLEIMVKSGSRKIREVPIHFAERKKGISKLNLKEAFNYFRHLRRLIAYKFF